MQSRHLSNETLLAIREGERVRSDELQHLASCPDCQEAFDDTRWTLLLARLRKEVPTTEHPARDELLAYATRALDGERQLQVREHLADCRRCMLNYARYRQQEKASSYASPSPELLGTVQRSFRPRPRRRLGALWIRRIADGLNGVFLPAKQAIAAHPSSASGRKRRLREEAEALGELDEGMAADFHDVTMDSYSIGSIRDHQMDLSLPEATTIDADPWQLQLLPIAEGDKPALEIHLLPTDTNQSPAGLQVRIARDDGTDLEGELDAEGKARLVLPAGKSRLVIELDPPLVVDLNSDT